MNFLRYSCSLLLIIFIFSCNANETTEEINNNENNEVTVCANTNVSISKQDNIVIPHATNPVFWEGSYNNNNLTISFTKPVGTDGETETKAFIFDKKGNCLTKNRAYEFYNGELNDVSAVTEITVSEFYIKEWIVDEKLTGLIVYTDPHDKKTYSRKFWVEFTSSDFKADTTNFLRFEDCFLNKLPIEVDMNSDNIIDFELTYEEINNIGNTPKYNQYTIKMVSTYENKNKILSKKRNQQPYFIIHQPPFTSENKKQYLVGVKDILDVFFEYEAPYQNFNYFLNNNLTNSNVLENNRDDYFIVSLSLNDEIFYGWIQFNFNVKNCEVEIIDTYLNPIAGEHISVD